SLARQSRQLHPIVLLTDSAFDQSGSLQAFEKSRDIGLGCRDGLADLNLRHPVAASMEQRLQNPILRFGHMEFLENGMEDQRRPLPRAHHSKDSGSFRGPDVSLPFTFRRHASRP